MNELKNGASINTLKTMDELKKNEEKCWRYQMTCCHLTPDLYEQ